MTFPNDRYIDTNFVEPCDLPITVFDGQHPDHPGPWRAEPGGHGGTWVVRDARGAVVAKGMAEQVADLLAAFPQFFASLNDAMLAEGCVFTHPEDEDGEP